MANSVPLVTPNTPPAISDPSASSLVERASESLVVVEPFWAATCSASTWLLPVAELVSCHQAHIAVLRPEDLMRRASIGLSGWKLESTNTRPVSDRMNCGRAL